MNRIIILAFLSIITASLAISNMAYAGLSLKSPSSDWIAYNEMEGWNEGPYALFGFGGIHADEDKNLITGEKFGSDYEMCYSLIAGWNITDHIATEGQVRFSFVSADFNGERQNQYILSLGLSGKYQFIDVKRFIRTKVAFIPYVKGGFIIYGLGVPGTNSNESKVAVYGPGAIAAGGLDILFTRHIFLELEAGGALVFLSEKKRMGVVVVKGGLDPQLSFTASVGVHF